jgi:hypothetical protein
MVTTSRITLSSLIAVLMVASVAWSDERPVASRAAPSVAAVKNQTAAAGIQQLNRLQSESQQLKKEESLAAKRQKVAEKRIEKDSVDRTGKTSQLDSRLHRLDLYLPVSFADQRQHLLKSFED